MKSEKRAALVGWLFIIAALLSVVQVSRISPGTALDELTFVEMLSLAMMPVLVVVICMAVLTTISSK